MGQISQWQDVTGGFPQTAELSTSKSDLAKGTNSELREFSQDIKFFKVKLFF